MALIGRPQEAPRTSGGDLAPERGSAVVLPAAADGAPPFGPPGSVQQPVPEALAMGEVVYRDEAVVLAAEQKWLGFKVGCRLLTMCALIFLVIWLIVKVLPRLLVAFVDFAEPISLGDFMDVLAVFSIYFVLTVLPLPGKNVWYMVIARKHGYWCLVLLMVSYLTGSPIAFMFGRWLRRRLLRHSCCFKMGQGTLRTTGLYMKSLRGAIEQHSFRMVLLISLAPGPTAIVAALIGAYADGLTCFRFIIPWTLGSLKHIREIFIGIKVADLAAYLRGESGDASDMVFTIATTCVAVGLGGYLGWYAQTEVERMSAQTNSIEAPPTVEQAGSSEILDSDAGDVSGHSGGHLPEDRPELAATLPHEPEAPIAPAVEPPWVFGCSLAYFLVVAVCGLLLLVTATIQYGELTPLRQALVLQFGSASYDCSQERGCRVQVELALRNPSMADVDLDPMQSEVLSRDWGHIGMMSALGQVIPGQADSVVVMLAQLEHTNASGSTPYVILTPTVQGVAFVNIAGVAYKLTYSASWVMRVAVADSGPAATLTCAWALKESLDAEDPVTIAEQPCQAFELELSNRLLPSGDWEWHKTAWLTFVLFGGAATALIGISACVVLLAEKFRHLSPGS